MSEVLPPQEEACPHCLGAVSAADEVCGHCQGRLTVDVAVAAPVADPRARYQIARGVLALGPPGATLGEVLDSLQRPGGLVARGLSRRLAGQVIESLASHGVAASEQEVQGTMATTGPRHPRLIALALAHPLATAGGVAGAVGGLALLLLASRPLPDLTPEEIGERARPATVLLRCAESVGSGFFVAREQVLTNAHVVCPEIQVQTADGLLAAEVVQRDDDIDLALLKVPGATAPSLPLGDATTLRVGEPVVILGSPRGLGDSLQRGTVSHVGRPLMGTVYVQVDANVNPGNSGGPLIDRKGRVVGVVSAANNRGRGIGFALPINYATRRSTFVRGPSERDWLGLTRPGVLLFQEWVSKAEQEDQKEAEEVRASLGRPTLIAAAPGPSNPGRSRTTIAILVQRSGWQPTRIARTFHITRNGLRACEGRFWVERWVHPEAEGGASEPLYLRWLRRHGLEEGLYLGMAPLEGSGCGFDEAVGGELAMDAEGGQVDRVPVEAES